MPIPVFVNAPYPIWPRRRIIIDGNPFVPLTPPGPFSAFIPVFMDADYPRPKRKNIPYVVDVHPFSPTTPSRPTISTTSPLPCATIGSPYSLTLVSVGVPPFTYTLIGGSFPPGLTLSSGGILSGTPTDFLPVIEATNADGTGDLMFDMTICCPGPVPVDNPTSGESYSREHNLMNLKLVRGDTLTFDLVIYLNGTPVDITGGRFRLTAKWSVTDDDSAAVFVLTSTPAVGITITDAVNGTLSITISPSDTINLPDHTVNLPFDVQLYDQVGSTYTVLYGSLQVIVDVGQTAP